MEPKIVKRRAVTLVGMVVSGPSVRDIDIGGLWRRFERDHASIKGAVKGKSFEVHIEEDMSPRIHFCFIGLEVRRPQDVPAGMFVKTLPAGHYAVFTHTFRDGGFAAAFRNVYGWLKKSRYTSAHHFDVQCYGKRYQGYDDPRSVIEILVPVKKK